MRVRGDRRARRATARGVLAHHTGQRDVTDSVTEEQQPALERLLQRAHLHVEKHPHRTASYRYCLSSHSVLCAIK